MLGTWLRHPAQAAAPIWAAACLGCYSYSAPGAVEPELQLTFAFELTDQGRAALATGIGAGTDRIEGVLVSVTDTTYTTSVARVVDIRGRVAKWNGEEVSLRREYVGTLRERRLSKSRTAIAAGGVAVAVVALVATGGFGVVGGGEESPGEKPPPGEESVAFPLTLLMTLFGSR